MTFRTLLKRAKTNQRSPIRHPLIHVVMISILLMLMITANEVKACEASEKSSEECEIPDPEKVRMVTREELATKTGVDGADIWLSIVGEVYDVTMGKDYYAPGSSYGAFAGRDASIPFCTGKFTAEEAEKNTEVLKSTELPGLVEWRDFYRAHNVYKFVGKLIDPRYYDDMGEPTPDMMVLQKRIQEARAEQALKSKIRREERLKKQKEKEAAQAKS